MSSLITIHNLRVCKSGHTLCEIPSLKVSDGERVVILGPNGCGKTTLLRVLGGLETAFTGRCEVAGAMRQRVYVHQSPYLFRGTVAGNVLYGLVAHRLSRKERSSRVTKTLVMFGIGHLADRPVEQLSGGERRRVALARAFILQPRLLLLDEPFAELDQQGVQLVNSAIESTYDCTIVIASPTPLPVDLGFRSVSLSAP